MLFAVAEVAVSKTGEVSQTPLGGAPSPDAGGISSGSSNGSCVLAVGAVLEGIGASCVVAAGVGGGAALLKKYFNSVVAIIFSILDYTFHN